MRLGFIDTLGLSDEDWSRGTMTASPLYRRVLLKLSGEALMGPLDYGIHLPTVSSMAEDIKAVHAMGVQVCLVVGGGNIFRGVSNGTGIERASADYMGMLA